MTTNETSQSLLAGVSGVLGGHIARALTEAGRQVTGLGWRRRQRHRGRPHGA
ncbi:hypothetical protein ABTX62_27765 [Streptomyces sp. NPDC096046]|uniref:hypothetical protein n=1 Tax=Streptomyces sp. NPDC096046 TaxID=3155542 RepID=UPI00331BAB38